VISQFPSSTCHRIGVLSPLFLTSSQSLFFSHDKFFLLVQGHVPTHPLLPGIGTFSLAEQSSLSNSTLTTGNGVGTPIAAARHRIFNGLGGAFIWRHLSPLVRAIGDTFQYFTSRPYVPSLFSFQKRTASDSCFVPFWLPYGTFSSPAFLYGMEFRWNHRS